MSCSGILVVELFWSSSPFSCFVDVTVNECLYYHPVTTAFELWCWRRLLRVPWTARRSNQSILKEISPEYSLEGLMLKLQYFGHLMWRTDSFEKTLMLRKMPLGNLKLYRNLNCHDLKYYSVWVVVVQSPSHVWHFATPWTAAYQASLSLTISWTLPKFMSIESVMLPNHLILCHPLLLFPSIFPSIRVFSNESAVCIGVGASAPRIGTSASASVLPMNIQGWFPVGLTGLILLSKGLWRVFSSTKIWKHQFFGAQPSLLSKSHICT